MKTKQDRKIYRKVKIVYNKLNPLNDYQIIGEYTKEEVIRGVNEFIERLEEKAIKKEGK